MSFAVDKLEYLRQRAAGSGYGWGGPGENRKSKPSGKLEFLRQRAEGTEMPATNSVRKTEKTQYFSLDEYGGDLEHGAADELSWRCAF